ncbi:MAG: Asp-tRNA(Asn)/Glu-tRNA(Gln) amidotransferase subunit GatA [Burkholderia sp.]|nr:Asp-tRNA(Asn)/Glu-tRNA(Gln) amidotransferase subunit GatA [Burkholderia sp.]
MHEKSLAELRIALDTKVCSAVELAQHYLKRIADASNLNAFVHIDSDLTLVQAKAADTALERGAGPLTGLPIAHKDVFVTRGWRSTACSRMLENYQSPFDATVVSRLSSAGMVTLGKTNMDEFSMGSSSENSAFGPVKNPWDTKAVPGGSSSGSSVAVAARLSPAATGTDTGGSIRQPASFTGITGIKPTYGRISRYGMIAFASSLDQGGPMAQSASDCAILLNAMVGFDERDSTSIEFVNEDFTRYLGTSWTPDASINKPLIALRIGIPREYFDDGLAEDVRIVLDSALKQYETLGASLIPVSLPKTKLSIPVYYVISSAEASSNLLRFDGTRYGHRAVEYCDLFDMYKKSRTEGFGSEVKRRILIGTYVLSHGYYDAYYLQAQKIRRIIAEDFQKAFKKCDVIMGPVSPTVAWNFGLKSNDQVQMYLSDIYTLSVNLAGLPGMSMPCGFSKNLNTKRPVGIQIIGNYFDEARMLQIADMYQRVTNWHNQIPAEKGYV